MEQANQCYQTGECELAMVHNTHPPTPAFIAHPLPTTTGHLMGPFGVGEAVTQAAPPSGGSVVISSSGVPMHNGQKINTDLWLRLLSTPYTSSVAGPATAATPRSNNNKGKVCLLYNRTGKCHFNPCRFRHACSNCNGNHIVGNCISKRVASAGRQSSTPQPSSKSEQGFKKRV